MEPQSARYPVVLTVAQQKGGVGKTTLARLLAVYASREDLLGKRVLLIDFDYQASLSKLSLNGMKVDDYGAEPPIHPEYDPEEDVEWNGRSSSADIFFDGFAVPYPVELPYPIENLQILPAHKAGLQRVEEQDRTKLREMVINRLHAFLSDEDVCDNFDLVIIDTGPKDSPLVRAAIRAATHMVIPLTMEAQCIDGLSEMLGLWRLELSARPQNRPLDMVGLVINHFDARYSTHNAYLSQLNSDERISPLLIDTILPRRAAVTDRDTKGTPAAVTFDLPRSMDIRARSLELCAKICSVLFPEEAERLKTLEPDDAYLLANRERKAGREASADESSVGVEAPTADAVDTGVQV
ncbi:ParA family protein [Sinimarinibacterium sp. CAU 1509]|uniref:ParA family protein n=1 Tax=Sinimarinibacterium sp. CAU 1509 TaxID=2562283 RepID=UPI0010AC5BC9|nr:ParA family protein [Sinimarinibacterium sp. CAU 1509]TJY57260.1 ParA family protein [Sinimarinibacterium sp. CAU 1509]